MIKPTPIQASALSCPAFELLFGGSKGGGKTHFLAMAPIQILAKAHQKFVS